MEPWYESYIAPMVAAQLATRAGHLAIAGNWRTVATHLAQIAAQHEALAAALPEAVETSAALATMATAHHQANVSTVLSGEQELNKRRDAQVDGIERRLSTIEAKLDQLIAGRCAACPLAQPAGEPAP